MLILKERFIVRGPSDTDLQTTSAKHLAKNCNFGSPMIVPHVLGGPWDLVTTYNPTSNSPNGLIGVTPNYNLGYNPSYK